MNYSLYEFLLKAEAHTINFFIFLNRSEAIFYFQTLHKEMAATVIVDDFFICQDLSYDC